MSEPLLPTAVVGSYSMPGWLERVKNDFLQRRISRHDLDEIHDMAVKAAIKDQEVAGVDLISDGELRRDNMIDYFAMRLPGVQTDHASKRFYYDFYDSVVRNRMPTASLGLVDDFRFLRRFTERRATATPAPRPSRWGRLSRPARMVPISSASMVSRSISAAAIRSRWGRCFWRISSASSCASSMSRRISESISKATWSE